MRLRPDAWLRLPSARAAPAPPPTSSATTTAAKSNRLCLIRRFASAISGETATGRREVYVVMAPLLLAPLLLSNSRSGVFREAGPRPVVQYEDVYRLCYVRGPEGILLGRAEKIG
jgi:hypothetical protein